MDQISFEDGIPLSMYPIPNNLKVLLTRDTSRVRVVQR